MATILVVEDERMIRDMLLRFLEMNGYQAITAANGVQALEQTRSNQPDLILMDMRLPVMDGWEATQQLKADSATRAIPIIALTAYAMTDDREHALSVGCDDYETKPIQFPKLLVKIKTYLGQANTAGTAS